MADADDRRQATKVTDGKRFVRATLADALLSGKKDGKAWLLRDHGARSSGKSSGRLRAIWLKWQRRLVDRLSFAEMLGVAWTKWRSVGSE